MDPDPESMSHELPPTRKGARQQLTKGMEHLRDYVTVSATCERPERELSDLPEKHQDAYGVPGHYLPICNAPNPVAEADPQRRIDPFQFGTRVLSSTDDIFSHNAWDHVQVDPAYTEFIEAQTDFQRSHRVSDFDAQRFNSQPAKWWDKFYTNNQANFFKDRKWLVQEFPILGEVTRQDYGPVTVLEVGAGAGNTAFPVLSNNSNPNLRLVACDYSSKAIDVIRAQDAYLAQKPGEQVLTAEVWDLAGSPLPLGLKAGEVDIVVMIFVFSALAPDQWTQAIANIWTLLKPGGQVLFRDYGRGDLAQVRFKKGRYLDENFYVRGDGTRVYFFAEEELKEIWAGSHPQQTACTFEIANLAVDRRMLVNRQRKIKMYRCWMQGLFKRPVETD